MSFELINETTPKARKPYVCVWCNEQILAGERYTCEVAKMEGELQVNRYHGECRHASSRAFAHPDIDLSDGWYPGQFKRGSLECKPEFA